MGLGPAYTMGHSLESFSLETSAKRVLARDRQWTGLQGGGGVNLGGSSGSTDNPTLKRFHFCIIFLNKINRKFFEKKP